MSVGVIEVPGSVRAIFEPKPRLSVCEWAAWKPFEIREKGATNPGPWDVSLTPYMREPLDAMGDPRVRRMNWVFCPQAGKTKGMEVGLCYLLEYQPTNMLYIRPTEPDIVEGFRDRWKSVIETNLPGLVPSSGEWLVLSNNPRIELKNQVMYGAAVTVARHMTSRSAPKIIYDETDTGGDTGNSLGNALDVADDRQMAANDLQSLTMGASSAKYETGSNWVAYESRSDRRVYFEPCPECGFYQELPAEPGKFEQRFVTVDGERDPDRIMAHRLGRFICERCGSLIDDSWQGWMSCRGVWVPRGMWVAEDLPLGDEEIREHRSLAWHPSAEQLEARPEADPDAVARWEPRLGGERPVTNHRGYRVWAANLNADGLNKQRSWSHMMARWFDVMKGKDPERIQVFVNSWKSLPWKESLKGLEEEQIKKRIGAHLPDEVPSRAKLIVSAIDVQELGYLVYDVWAFGPGAVAGRWEAWTVKHGTWPVVNDRYQEAIEKLRQFLLRGFPVKGEKTAEGRQLMMRPYLTLVDSGYAAGDVYEACRAPGMLAVKGQDRADYTVRLSEVEGKLREEPVELLHVNNFTVKGRLHRELMAAEDEPGLWLHAETEDEWVSQLASMELRAKKTNKAVKTWQKKSEGRADHAHDVGTYILAGVEALEQKGEVSLVMMRPEDPRRGVFYAALPGSAGQEVRAGVRRVRRRRRRSARVEGLPDVPDVL